MTEYECIAAIGGLVAIIVLFIVYISFYISERENRKRDDKYYLLLKEFFEVYKTNKEDK